MNINNVYICPYYGSYIECHNKPFFCDRDGVLIYNDKKSICRINIDADIEYSLQNAIDYISKCKVRGEKGGDNI